MVSDLYVLGMFDFATYQPCPLQLCDGDILVVFSDGLTDAENPQGEMFGDKRLLTIIRQEAPSGGCALERSLLKAIAEFTQGTPQTDDITFVVTQKMSLSDRHNLCRVVDVLGDSEVTLHGGIEHETDSLRETRHQLVGT